MIKNYMIVGWRNLRRNKSYSVINIFGLSLGIGSCILIFCLISYHLSFDVFHLNKGRIFRVVSQFHEDQVEYTPGVPQPLAKAFNADYNYAEQVARVKSNQRVLVSVRRGMTYAKFSEETNVAFADPQFFEIFSFPLLQGDRKTMLAEPNSAIITKHIAHKYFATQNAIGKIIRIDNKADFKITAILEDIPANTDRKEEIYLSFLSLKIEDSAMARDDSWGRVSSSMQCFMLLKPAVTIETVDKAFVEFAKKHLGPEDAKITVFKLQPLSDIHFNTTYGAEADKKYLVAFAFVGLFLVITASVNFINLATARALERGKEVGVRKVLGGRPQQLFWQFIMETALITMISVAFAFGFASLCLPYLNILLETHIMLGALSNVRFVAFLLTLFFVVVLLSGSYPGLVLARFRPISALKGKLSQENVGAFSLRRTLVVVQFMISQVLIIGTLVIARQAHFSTTADLGFNKSGIILLPIPVNDISRMTALRIRLGKIPGVENISLCQQTPASQSNHLTDVRYDNRSKEELWEINEKGADDQYLKTFSLKLIAGRNLFVADTAREFLVNETAVKKLGLLSATDIIGKTLHAGGQAGPVVGVMRDFYNASFRKEIAPLCVTSDAAHYNICAVKVNIAEVNRLISSFSGVWNDTYPDQLFTYQFMDDRIANFYKNDYTMLTIVEVLAVIAIAIGCLGLYGLISFMTIRKTKEIGIRKVLGASLKNIIWMFGREFVSLLVISFLMAVPVAWWMMTNYLQDFKYRIKIGPGIFAGAISIILFIAACTVTYRSLKAALANPVKSLHME